MQKGRSERAAHIHRNFRPISRLLWPRVIDTLFPYCKRKGVAAVPGPFGSGRSSASACKMGRSTSLFISAVGERGNEMTDVLNEFPN